MILPADEQLHPIGTEKHWQESWYFNWADARTNYFGMARIGLRFHERQIDGLIFTILDGKPHFAYPAINVRPHEPWRVMDPKRGIKARALTFQMLDPLKHWRLTLEGRNHMELDWKPFNEPFDYRDSIGHGPPEIASAHFEQSGRVTGITHFKGRELRVDGTGERDKSWGVRDWSAIEGWTWISVQFGADFSFNLWEAPSRGQRYSGGFVFYDGANHALEEFEVRLQGGTGAQEPRGATIRMRDASGTTFVVEAESHGVFPLAKKGLWIQEAYITCDTELHGEKRKGVGILEYTFHVGTIGILKRFPEIASTLTSVFLRSEAL